jgi:hypothetical protein
MGNQIDAYIALVEMAAGIAKDLGAIVRDAVLAHAQRQLTPEEMAALKARWQEDVDRSARNAGL